MPPKPKKPIMQAQQVVTANALVEASYRLSLVEKQVVLLAVAQIGQRKDLTEKTPLSVTAQDLIDTFRAFPKDAYGQLHAAVEQLANRWVTIDRPDPDDPDLERTKTRWVHAIDYKTGKGTLRLYFSPKILPYLTSLAREFTQYRLHNTAGMTSVYAVRIYELLVQWRTKGELDVELDWLREKFDLPSSYSGISELKKRVIKPAIDQINEHSDLWVKWDQRKEGRQVVAFIFTFGVKSKQPSQSEVRRRPPSKKELERAARPGESWEEVKRRLGLEQ